MVKLISICFLLLNPSITLGFLKINTAGISYSYSCAINHQRLHLARIIREELLGGSNERRRKPKKSSLSKAKTKDDQPKVNIDQLEKQVLSKYGSKVYDEEIDEDDEFPSKTQRSKNELPSNLDKSKKLSLKSLLQKRKNTEITENNENTFDDFENDTFDSIFEEDEIEALTTTPSSGFRLRRPPPKDPVEEEKKRLKEREKEIEMLKKKEIKAARRSAEKGSFFPFTFGSIEEGVAESQRIFTDLSFPDIGVNNTQILTNLENMNIVSPTRIQELAVPLLSKRNNMVLEAQTGSGKTLAYLLPMLSFLDSESNKVQAIVLAPSRELVLQIGQVASLLFQDTNISTLSLIGGANVRNQIKHLREDRPQLIIATPGRLAELVFSLEKVKLGGVNTVVIDEVDQMLQEPFLGEIKTLLQATPLTNSNAPIDTDVAVKGLNSKYLLCLASATGNDPKVMEFADEYCGADKWERVAVKHSSMLPAGISHGLISVPRVKAFEMLKKFLNAQPYVERALIFVNDPHRVEVVAGQLLSMGIIAAPLHGDTAKEDRKDIIARIKDGRLGLVVTTELAARGLDIPELSHVINFELPTDSQHYVHRAGRCGRAGRKGLVMNFANPSTKFVIRRFGKKLGAKIHDCELRDGQVYLKKT